MLKAWYKCQISKKSYMDVCNHKSSYFLCISWLRKTTHNSLLVRVRLWTPPLHRQTYYQDRLYSQLPPPLFFHTLLFEKSSLPSTVKRYHFSQSTNQQLCSSLGVNSQFLQGPYSPVSNSSSWKSCWVKRQSSWNWMTTHSPACPCYSGQSAPDPACLHLRQMKNFQGNTKRVLSQTCCEATFACTVWVLYLL